MVFDWVLMLDGGPDPVPSGLGKLSLMENVQKLFGLHGIQIKTIAANKLQRIPWRRIMTSSHGNPSVSIEPGYRRLQAGRRTDAKIDNLTTRSQKSGHNC